MTRLTTRLLAAFAAVAFATPALASTYYVAPTGSDSGSGSSSAPFLTLQAAVDAASAGDTITVRDGTYGPTGGSGSMAVTIAKAGTSSSWITLQAEHAGAAVLDCQLTCHSYINLASGSAYWIIKGFDIRNGMWGALFANSSGAQNIVVQNNLIHNIGNRYDASAFGIMGIYTDAGAYNWTIDANVFHDIGRNAVLTGTHDHGVYTHGGAMKITNNVFYALKNGWHIQTAEGFSGGIANNTFYGPDPVAGKVGQVMLWGANSNLIVRNNIFYGASSSGITTYALTVSGSCRIDHNLAFTPGASMAVIDSVPGGCTESNETVNVDPKLVSPGADFHLAPGSPAIDAGAAVSGVTTDFAGAARPQGAAFDVGAYEYSAAAPPPTPTPIPAGCVSSGATAWTNVALSRQTGVFTLQFDATPSTAKMDGVIGASNGGAADYSSLGPIVRFNSAGAIDARNGPNYAAASAIPYAAGLPYHFRLLINVPAHTYSAYVKQDGGAEQLVGSNYAFRTEQASTPALSSLGLLATTGGEIVCGAAAAVAPPAISGVAASNVTVSAAVITWTTDQPTDSAVDYGLSSGYGTTTPTDPGMTTSHSVALSNLAPATVYHYRVRSSASGTQGASPDATFTTASLPPPPPGGGCVSVAPGSWKNVAIGLRAGTFTVNFDAKPSQAGMDAVLGLANAPASGFSSLAAAVRFNSAGKIDARNAAGYSAQASIPYSPGTTYHFRLVISVATRTYSAFVAPGAGAEIQIAANYAFRTEQAGVSSLSFLALGSDIGSPTVCALVSAGAMVPLR